MRKLWGIIGALWCLSGANLAFASCSTEQLTHDAAHHSPLITERWVLWTGYELNEENERTSSRFIFLYDLNEPHEIMRLTDDLRLDTFPQIDGNLVVWQGGAASDYAIFLYDIDSATTTQLTDNELLERVSPRIHNGRVVWATRDESARDIFLYDHATGVTTQLTDGANSEYSPQIYGERIVWVDVQQGPKRLVLWQAGETTVISEHADLATEPQINDRWIAWTDATLPWRSLYVYDLETHTETLLSEQAVPSWVPSLSERGIVWAAYEGVSEDADILYYDGIQVRQLTTNVGLDIVPSLSGGVVVWTQDTGGMNIVQYDLNTGIALQITDSEYNVMPRVNQRGDIVWLGNSGIHGGDIFLYRCF